MSLTLADVRRLERGGHRDFCELGDDGALRLCNVAGRCVFLTGSRCDAYPDRPDGCVLYPLIWFTADGEPGEAGLHEFCPHRYEFRFSQGDREWLARSIAAEDREVAARRGGSVGSVSNTGVGPARIEGTTRRDD
jgi:Fe-S-cluster containining protein